MKAGEIAMLVVLVGMMMTVFVAFGVVVLTYDVSPGLT